MSKRSIKKQTTLTLGEDDAAVIVRGDGCVEVLAPMYEDNDIVPDPVLALMMVSMLMDEEGIADLAEQFKAHGAANGIGASVQ